MDSVVLVSFHVGYILSSTIGNGVLKSIEICFCFPVYFFSLAVGSQLQNLSDLPHQDLVSCSDRNPAISPPGGRAACSHSPRPGACLALLSLWSLQGDSSHLGQQLVNGSTWAWWARLLLLCREIETGTTIDIEGDGAPNPDPKSLRSGTADRHLNDFHFTLR